MNGRFTCHKPNGASVVDYVIVSEELLPKVGYFCVHKFIGELSDHCKLSFSLNLMKPLPKQNKQKGNPLPKRVKWSPLIAQKVKLTLQSPNFVHMLDQFDPSSFGNDGNAASNACEYLTNIISQATMSASKPHSKNGNKHNKEPRSRKHMINNSFSPELYHMKQSLSKKAVLLDQNPFNKKVRQDYFLLLKHFRQKYKQHYRAYRKGLLEEISMLRDNDPKAYWQLLDQLNNLDKTSKSHADNIGQQEWFEYFQKLNKKSIDQNKELDILTKLQELNIHCTFNELDVVITDREISMAVTKLKNGKATGLDNICSEAIKYNLPELLKPLKKLFNFIFSTSYYPKQWGMGYITPIYKKEDPSLPDNYRGITIMSNVAKLFNCILNNRLIQFLEKHNVITDLQTGFMKGSRTSDHIFVLKTLIDKYIKKNKKPLYVCFVDFKKAFDRIWHNALLYKLKLVGVGDLFFKTIESMYSNINLAVKSNGSLTDYFQSNIGIRQGDTLSPLLFNIYVNDIPAIFNQESHAPILLNRPIPCLLYADDLVILSTSKEGLQNSLNCLYNYGKQWALDINTQKTKVIIFNNGGKLLKHNFTYNSNLLECVKEYSYLGMIFSVSGNFTTAKKSLTGKGLKAHFKLCRSLGRGSPHVKMGLHVFDHVVKPVLLYGSEVWGAFDTGNSKLTRCDPCFKVEKAFDNLLQEGVCIKFYKNLLGVYRTSDNNAIMGELGRYPLFFDVVSRMLKYWVRLEKLPDDKLLKEAYLCNEQLTQRGTWVNSIKFLLKELDLDTFWVNKPSDNRVVNKAKKLLQIRFQKCWQNNLFNDTRKAIGQKRKLRTYRKFKINFEMEDYLEVIKNSEHRLQLLKFRISSHKLHIETGRSPHIPVEDRLCKVCNTNSVEDELHFLLNCNSYDELRDEFTKGVTSVFPGYMGLADEEKFIWALSSKHTTVMLMLSKFVSQGMTLRAQILENENTSR